MQLINCKISLVLLLINALKVYFEITPILQCAYIPSPNSFVSVYLNGLLLICSQKITNNCYL